MHKTSDKSTSFLSKLSLNCGDKTLSLENPVVMGILNITPDSFYDGGKFLSEKKMLSQTEKMLSEGTAIIDIGAISTRPGASEIPKEEEKKKLIKALKLILQHFPETIISIDTYRSHIAEAAVNEGASIINDISGGMFDDNMFKTVAKLKVPYILMHIKGTPKTMQINPVYDDVVKEIKEFFTKQIQLLAKAGVTGNIVLDPGFGFGKTVENNFEILYNLKTFCELGFPVMAGLSRKSMINNILKISPEDALNGTTALNTIALLNGANILRVHDVKEAMEAIKLVGFYKKTN